MDAATERIVCRPLAGGHHPNGVRNRAPERKSLDRGTAQYPFGVTTETKPPQTDGDRARDLRSARRGGARPGSVVAGRDRRRPREYWARPAVLHPVRVRRAGGGRGGAAPAAGLPGRLGRLRHLVQLTRSRCARVAGSARRARSRAPRPTSGRARRAAPTTRRGRSRRRRRRSPPTAAAIACDHVFSLPRSRAAITTPRSIAAWRRPEISSSRATIAATIHAGNTPWSISTISVASTSSLSATGIEQRAERRRPAAAPRDAAVEPVGRHRDENTPVAQ